jgi:hypothetical protein
MTSRTPWKLDAVLPRKQKTWNNIYIGGIIHYHDQIPLLPRYPFMSTSVLMEHHPRQWGSFPALAVRTPPSPPWLPVPPSGAYS